MRPEPFRHVGRYDPKSLPSSLSALEVALRRQFHSIDTALLSLEPTDRITSTYTARPLDMVRVDPTSAAFDVILPAPVPGGGWIMVKNIGTSTNTVTLRPFRSDVTIDGASTYALSGALASVWLVPVTETQWSVMTGGLTTVPTLAEVLGAGNSTGAYDIDVDAGQAIDFQGDISIQDGGVEYIGSTATTLLLRPAGTTVLTLDSGGPTIASGLALDFVGAINIQDDGVSYIGSTATELVLKPAATTVLTVSTAAATMASGMYLDFIGTVDIRDDATSVYTSGTVSSVLYARIPQGKMLLGTTTGDNGLYQYTPATGTSLTAVLTYDRANNTLAVGSTSANGPGTLNLSTGGTGGIDFKINQSSRILWLTAAAEFDQGYKLQWNDTFGSPYDVLYGTVNDTYIDSRTGGTIFCLKELDVSVQGILVGASFIAFGSNPADTGALRFSNGDGLYWEASPAGTDVRALTVDSSEIVTVGHSTAAANIYLDAVTSIQARPGGTTALTVDSGGPTVASGLALDFVGAIAIQDDGVAFLTSTATTVVIQPAATTVLTVSTTAATLASTMYLDFAGDIDIRDGATSFISSTASTLSLKPAGSAIVVVDSGGITMTAATTVDWASGTAILSTGGTAWLTDDGSLTTLAHSLAIGADPADTGTIRLENAATIYFEASPAGTDIRALTVDSSERVIVGEDTNAVDVQVRAATSVELYAGANLIAEAKAGEVEIQSTYALDFAGELKITRAGTDYITSTSGIVQVPTGTLSIGSTPATEGGIRIPSGWTVFGRNAGNTDNIRAFGFSGDNIIIGDSDGSVGGSTYIYAATSNTVTVRVGGVVDIVAISSTELECKSGIALDFAGELKITRAGTDYITSTSGVVLVPQGALSIGGTVASTGAVRLANTAAIYERNAANSADVRLVYMNASNDVAIGDGTNGRDVYVDCAAARTTNFRVGGSNIFAIASTAAQAQTGIALDFAGELKISRAGTDYITSTAGVVNVPIGALSVGSTPATAGALRFQNNTHFSWRNAANSGNVRGVYLDATDYVVIGEDLTSSGLQLNAGTGLMVGRVAAANIWVTRATEFELQSSMALDFAGEIGITRAGTSYVSSTSTTMILSPAGTTLATLRTTELELAATMALDWASGTASLTIGGTAFLASTTSVTTFSAASLNWAAAVVSPTLTQVADTTPGATGDAMTLYAQAVTATTGTNVGGIMLVTGGPCTGSGATSNTGGQVILRPGSASGATSNTSGAGKLQTAGGTNRFQWNDTGIGFYTTSPIAQPSSTGETTGFTAGGGTTATSSSTWTGNVGSTAYTTSDIVKHLKNLGLIAS